MDNKPQAETYSATKVSTNETDRRETSREPHVMTRPVRKATCKNQAPKTIRIVIQAVQLKRMLVEHHITTGILGELQVTTRLPKMTE